MEKLLKIVEKPSSTELAIDAGRLKFFNSKLKIWDYTKISIREFQKLLFDDRSNILKKFYMSAKYSVGAGKISFSFSVLGCF